MKKWLVGLTCAWMGLATAMGQTVWFNEVNYDPVGTDVAGSEWLEVAGPAGIDLSNYVVVRYNGNGAVVYGTTTLSGIIDDEGCGYGAVELVYPAADSLQNGSPDGLALGQVSGGVTTLVQFLSYEGVFTASNGVAAGVLSVDIGTQLNTTNHTLQLAGEATAYAGFGVGETNVPSMGSLNLNQTITGCTPVQQTNVSFFASGAMVDENQGTYEVTVRKSIPEGDVSGEIALSGTAAYGGGADYTIDTTNFTLNGTTTSAVLTVTINDDATSEPAETVAMDFANVVGAGITAPAAFTLTINASDQAAYGITIVTNNPGEGTVTTTPPTEAIEGATVTVTTAPAGGYRVASVAVVDEAMNPVAVSGAGPYTFTMPALAVTVTVTFEVYAAPDMLIDFEDYTTNTYAQHIYNTAGVSFTMTNVLGGATEGSDRFNGLRSARFYHYRTTGNAALMTQTAPFAQPITKLTFWFADYGTDVGGTFKVQVSDDGSSWQDVGAAAYDPAGTTLEEGVIDSIPANMTYIQFITLGTSVKRVNIDDIGVFFGAATYGVTFDKTSGFEVEEGSSDSVFATAANGIAPYIYGWTSSLEGTYFTADSNRFTILATAPIGDYSATVVATDSSGPAQIITNSLNFSVVAPAMYYSITITPPVNGAVTTTPETQAAEGSTVTVNATPDLDYVVDAITVNGGAVPVVGSTFTMPSSAATVTVTFKVQEAANGELIISQYYEGTGFNKWIEIYNPGAVAVDLGAGGYRVGSWNNAVREDWKTDGVPTLAVVLSNSIAAGGTYLVGYPTASNPVYAVANQTAGWAFNGDDSVVLYTGSTYAFANVVDAFGWTAASGAADKSYVRASNVTAGVNTDFNAADWVEFSLAEVEAAGETVNERIGYHSTGAPVFSVSVNKANGFVVNEGAGDAITATAVNGTEPYAYEWTSTLGGAYYTADSNLFTILATAPVGVYTSTVTATDATMATAQKTVTFSVVGGLPTVIISGSLSGDVGVEMNLTITLANETANDWFIYLTDPDGLDDITYNFNSPPAFTLTPAKSGTYVLTAEAATGSGNYSNTVNLTIGGGGDIWTIGGGTGGTMFTTLSNLIIVLPTNYMLNAVYGSDASGAGLNNLGQGLGPLTPGLDYTWTPATRTVTILNSATNRRMVRIGATPP